MSRRTIPAVLAGLLAAAVLVLSGCSASTLDDRSGPSDQEISQESAEIQQEQEANTKLQPWQPPSEPPAWCSENYVPAKGFNARKSKILMAECGVEPNWEEEEQYSSGDDFEDRCEYDPTYNHDWHDDMVCDGERLYLLPDDDFVERGELEQAAREWIA